MKKKILIVMVVLSLLIQSIFLIFINKEIEIKDESIKDIKKEKNIEEIFSEIDKMNKLEINRYSKVNNKWVGEFKFKGNLKEAKNLINNIKNFNISSYYIVYEEKNILIEGLLEYK